MKKVIIVKKEVSLIEYSKKNQSIPNIIPIKEDFNGFFIAITTYNRENEVKALIDTIISTCPFPYKINVIDDSPENPFFYEHENVDYLVHEHNYGKKYYWKTVNEHLEKYKSSNLSHFLQIDDDMLLKDGFFNKLKASIDSIPKSIIKIHLDYRDGKSLWGLKKWVDGGACYPRRALEALNYSLNPIPLERWLPNPLLSSGVWQQVSTRLNAKRIDIHSPKESFVEHIGHESMMNPQARKDRPIISK